MLLVFFYTFSGAIIINSSPLLPSSSPAIRKKLLYFMVKEFFLIKSKHLVTLFNSWNDDSERDTSERHEGFRRESHAMCPHGSWSFL